MGSISSCEAHVKGARVQAETDEPTRTWPREGRYGGSIHNPKDPKGGGISVLLVRRVARTITAYCLNLCTDRKLISFAFDPQDRK